MSAIIEDDKVVLFHDTLTNDEGEVLDSSEGREPLPYLHGHHNIVPGLERQLAGKAAGDSLTAVVPPAEGYGELQPPVPPVPKAELPGGVEVGMQLLAEMPDGSRVPLWVEEVREAEVVLTRNHPLAGVTLHFAIEIVGIRDALAVELEQGHPAAPEDLAGPESGV